VNTSLTETDYRTSADYVNGFRTSRPASQPRPRSGRAHRHITRLQRAGAVLIAGACLFAAAWYVPGVVAADGRSLGGTVTSSGLVYLNFASSGQVAKVSVRVGQRVRRGQLLGTEAAPTAAAVAAADRAAITSARLQLDVFLAQGEPTDIAAARAQLARDRAQLAIDHAKVIGTRIVAPSAGTVVAVNAQPGEAASAQGIHDYSAESPATPVTQQPLFSLFPEGPQANVQANASNSALALPVIELRTSSAWQVTVLVPENSVLAVRPGMAVTISVPAAGIRTIPGRVQELLATPVLTSEGIAYQAVVTVLGHQAYSPPSGMAADVQLAS
jgi:multidrug efflux pump subunit AcrA (membrane-fusion protein)